MTNIDPENLAMPLAGWALFLASWITFGILYATGKITAGSIMEMWKSAYENEREARREESAGRSVELAATMATLIHMLKSFQRHGKDEEG